MTSTSRMAVSPTVRVSTTGDSPETTTVSASAPTAKSALTVAVNPVVSTIPSRLTVVKPANENVMA